MNVQGYTLKKYNNIKLLIRDSLIPECSDKQWKAVCLGLFSDKERQDIQKEGAYKTVLKTTVNETLCIVKKYRNNGFIRKIKSPFCTSKAMVEFRAAVYIHNKGIPTAPPLFMAEKRRFGFVAESLVALPFLSGAQELKDVFFNFKAYSLFEKRKILENFGRLTGKIFQQGVFQNDYSLNNFMTRREQKKQQIYFIDFERVKIKPAISESDKLFLLAKLNRIGREVGLPERMCFLQAYLNVDPGFAENVKDLALKIQEKTVAVLKRDLKRGRLTSIYTHGNYERIKLRGYKGFYKKGYDPEEIIRQSKDIPDDSVRAKVSLNFIESGVVLQAVQFKGHDLEKIWSAISTLIIAGLPAKLPHIMLIKDNCGFIMFTPSNYDKLRLLVSSQTQLPDFIKNNFPEEIEKLRYVTVQ